MKVLHVPFCFRPDPVGGTEVYVEALAREQQRRGIEVVVAAPAPTASEYVVDDLRVQRFATMAEPTLEVLYGDGDHEASQSFARVLDREQPDLVHMHALTSAVSGRLADEAHRRGMALVFTYHTPTVSCQRGTLLRWGSEVCDGTLIVHTCAACALHGRGAARPTSLLLGALPTAVGATCGSLGLAGGPWTGLRMTELVQRQHTAWRHFMDQMDHLVVLCTWAGDVLVRNGVPARRFTLSRHGLPRQSRLAPNASRAPVGDTLRVAFLGRLDPTKGADVLINAMLARPDAPLELDLFCIAQTESASAYERSLRALAASDARVRFRPPVPSSEVPGLLGNYDLVAVPSRWLETGPLVVLEAFAAGVPVIGSRLGGIAELVHDGVDGMLVAPESVSAWSAALDQLAHNRQQLERLRAGIRPPRAMSAVADDMQAIYTGVLHGSAVGAPGAAC